MEDYERKAGNEKNEREEIFSKVVRAGKRTYFFDVKATRKNDYYLTLTESKKIFDRDGRFHFEKHKLFLYKEDFEKFQNGLAEVVDFIREAKKDEFSNENNEETNEKVEVPEVIIEEKSFSDVEFEDLGGEK